MKRLYTLLLIFISVIQLKAQPCSDLFFSEYVEGSSFNKAIEIFNPTPNSVDLSNYKIMTFFNGNDTAQYKMTLFGTLAPNEVWIGCHSSADSVLKSLADTTNSFVFNWNGNDAIALVNISEEDTLDVIGVIGDDPGASGWAVDTGSTANHTLVRMPDVQEGTTDWTEGQDQWLVYAEDDFSHLGFHDMTPCTATAVNNVTENFLQVYPAVSGGIVHLASPEKYSLKIFDVFGNEVIRMQTVFGNSDLNLVKFPSGIYFLQFESGSELQVKKIMIQK